MKRRPPAARARLAHLAFAASLVLLACAEPASTGEVRTDSANVRIVRASGIDRPLSWTLEREQVLGGADRGPELFHRIQGGFVNADVQGRLYVLDPANAQIVAFDNNGNFRWATGRRGGGPGEFRLTNSVAVAVGGAIVVHDPAKGALLWFDSIGMLLREHAYPHSPIRAWNPSVFPVGEGLVALVQPPFAGSDERPTDVMLMSVRDTATLLSMSTALSRTARYPSCGITLTLPVLFGTRVLLEGNGIEVAVVSGPEYVVDVFDATGSRTSVRRDIEPAPVTEAEALDTLRRRGVGGPLAPCRVQPGERLANHGYASRRQLIDAISLDHAGNLWVRRTREGESPRIDVFEADGRYSGTLPAGFPFPLVFMPNDRIGFAETDSLDVQRLVIAGVRK